MSDFNYTSLNAVTLVGRVHKRWDGSNDRAPLTLLVETYKRLGDGRKIPRKDRCVIWGDYLKGGAAGISEGDTVSIVGALDSEKDKDGQWRDVIRVQTVQPGGGVSAKRDIAPSIPDETPYQDDESIPF